MEVFLTINDILITFNWYISIIVISKWWNKWDARSKMIDHDNRNHSGVEMSTCFHAGVEMRCEV